MKRGWGIKKLGDICHTSNGLWKGKKPPFITIGVLRSTNFTKDCRLKLDDVAYIEVEENSFAKRKLQKNDIVVERSGGGPNQPVGRVLLFDIDDDNFSFCNFTSALRVIDSSYISPIYLHKYLSYFYLSGKTIEMQSNTIGLRNLDYTKYLDIEIPIPPLAEQRRIVEILDKEFERIDALKANAEQNLQHAKDLFSKSLKTLFDGEKLTLGEVLNLRRGYDLTHNEMNGGDVPVAGSGGIIGYHNIVTPITPCITVGRSGSVGKVYIYEKCWAHNTVLYVDDFKGNNPYYLTYLLISLDLSNKKSGCGVPTLNRNYLHPIRIGFNSSIEEQNAIVARLDKLKEHCKALKENYTKTIALCDDMKQALLRKAFNGEL